jgi:hypothetical protein
MTDTPLHYVWRAMRQRCNNPRAQQYKYYGGRGIRVCKAWEKFENFHAWALSHGYQSGLWLDRRHTNGNYAPSNCRFATRSQQAQSRRKRQGTSSRFLGVLRIRDGVYKPYVKLGGQMKYLPVCSTDVQAARTRDVYVKQHYDSYATLNEV